MSSRWFQHSFCQGFPVSHLMRSEHPDYWLRIHSLPDSKRYPEDEAERQIVLDRYARFGTALLGKRAPCRVIESRLSGYERAQQLMPELSWTLMRKVEWSEEDYYDSCVAQTVWDVSKLRTLLLAIANDQERHVAFVSDLTDCVFIPYDGGSDGFSYDTVLLRRLSNEFAPWGPADPLGQ